MHDELKMKISVCLRNWRKTNKQEGRVGTRIFLSQNTKMATSVANVRKT